MFLGIAIALYFVWCILYESSKYIKYCRRSTEKMVGFLFSAMGTVMPFRIGFWAPRQQLSKSNHRWRLQEANKHFHSFNCMEEHLLNIVHKRHSMNNKIMHKMFHQISVLALHLYVRSFALKRIIPRFFHVWDLSFHMYNHTDSDRVLARSIWTSTGGIGCLLNLTLFIVILLNSKGFYRTLTLALAAIDFCYALFGIFLASVILFRLYFFQANLFSGITCQRSASTVSIMGIPITSLSGGIMPPG